MIYHKASLSVRQTYSPFSFQYRFKDSSGRREKVTVQKVANCDSFKEILLNTKIFLVISSIFLKKSSNLINC